MEWLKLSLPLWCGRGERRSGRRGKIFMGWRKKEDKQKQGKKYKKE